MNQISLPPFEQLSFLTEARLYHKCPEDKGRELALIGRSNTGKSSIVNAIARSRKMAKTSKLPGHTKGMIFFSWPQANLRLVDLPGFGFAQTNKDIKKQWHKNITLYLERRQSLVALLLLIDCRRQPRETERNLVSWCKAGNLQFRVCLTKVDKITRNQQVQASRQIRSQLGLDLSCIHLCSVKQPATIVNLRNIISDLLCPVHTID